jgi:hypothetical protein
VNKDLRSSLVYSLGGTVAIGAVAGGYELYTHHYGATVDDIANVDLSQPMSVVERRLPATHEHVSRVETRFRHGVPRFEKAEIRFDSTMNCAVGIELERAHDEEHRGDKKEGADDSSRQQQLEHWLPGVDPNGEWSWGAVTFTTNATTLSFRVKADATNPAAFHQVVDAARQVLLAVAFDRPTTSSLAELQLTLGVGHPISALSALDPAQDFEAHASELRARFPSAVQRSHSLDIPIDHPAVRSVALEWASRGRLDRVRAKPRKVGLPTFGECVKPKLPSTARIDNDEIRVDASKSPSDFTTTLAAIDACR